MNKNMDKEFVEKILQLRGYKEANYDKYKTYLRHKNYFDERIKNGFEKSDLYEKTENNMNKYYDLFEKCKYELIELQSICKHDMGYIDTTCAYGCAHRHCALCEAPMCHPDGLNELK